MRISDILVGGQSMEQVSYGWHQRDKRGAVTPSLGTGLNWTSEQAWGC